MNAKNGRVQWESLSDDEMLNPKPKLPLPLQDDLRSSFARRRRSFSHSISRNRHRQVQQKENCMHFYRRSILASGILPFLYWDHMFVQTKALHFDSQQKLEKQFYHAKRAGNKMKSSWFTGKQGNAAHRHQPMLHYGKPNVVATINEHGLQIRSIRNGRLLCHLSFWANTLYTDLNHDGTLDSVSLVMSGRSLRDDDDQGEKRKWVSKLIKNIAKVRGDVNAMRQVEAAIETQTILEAHLCHLTVLSGLPAKEELFSTFLCGPSNLHDAEEFHASPAPPLVVEAIHGSARDVVVAVSTGYVTRVHGTTGRVVWQNGQLRASDPLWEDDAVSALTRVQSMMLAPESRPILLHGERSLAIYSARHGKLLESLSYPQSSRSKPITDDFNGDGTSDVIIGTDDALWGYIIHVQVGSPLLFRVAVGLLLMLMMLALLRNRFGPQPGRRSSDA
ncbi:hypothetical protein MPSEU_000364200 [Mayamaea pseudoterrestris]|nr:hypothetical protein MPSEU_000364200 [Mayamaea pseudoterrestris]